MDKAAHHLGCEFTPPLRSIKAPLGSCRQASTASHVGPIDAAFQRRRLRGGRRDVAWSDLISSSASIAHGGCCVLSEFRRGTMIVVLGSLLEFEKLRAD